MPLDQRSDLGRLASIAVPSPSGRLVPLSELVRVKEGIEDKTIYHKNLKRVTYVIGDLAGRDESPVYAILNMRDAISGLKIKEGYGLRQYSSVQPWLEDRTP
jgi:multidrug efflux pump subunit AcrB